MSISAKIPCYCFKTRRAAAAITRRYDRALAPCGVTVGQFLLLRNLAGSPGCTVSGLAAAVGLDRSTLARNLRPLLGKGLARDASPAEARDCRLDLTDAGRQTLECAQERWEAALAALEEL